MTGHKTDSGLHIETIERTDGFYGLESDWNALLRSCFHNHIFVSFEWISAWWKAFGRANKLFILKVTDAGRRIVAIAPLMKTRVFFMGLPVRCISFIYNDNASRTDFIVDKDHPAAVNGIIAFLNAHPGWDTITLPNVWRESKTFRLTVEALKRQGCRYVVKDGLHSLYIRMPLDWNNYYTNRSVRFRKHLRNSENRINRVKDHQLRCIRNISERPAVIQELCSISEKSWKAQSHSHMDRKSDDRVLFEELTRLFGERQWLDLWVLDLDQKPVAYDYLVQYNGAAYALRSDYDEKYAIYSPGSYLHLKTIRKYIEQKEPLREYEFCGHDEEYKTKWTGDIKEHATITVYRNSWYGMLLYVLDYRLLYQAKQWLKQFDILKKLKKIITRTR